MTNILRKLAAARTTPDGGTDPVITHIDFEVDNSGNMGNFLGGTETSGGETLTFDANWNVTGRAKQVDANATALTQTQLDAIPDALETTRLAKMENLC